VGSGAVDKLLVARGLRMVRFGTVSRPIGAKIAPILRARNANCSLECTSPCSSSHGTAPHESERRVARRPPEASSRVSASVKHCQKRLVLRLAVLQLVHICLPSCFDHRAVDDGYKKMESVCTASRCLQPLLLCNQFGNKIKTFHLPLLWSSY
jgi:hypothetical protein